VRAYPFPQSPSAIRWLATRDVRFSDKASHKRAAATIEATSSAW
jgi:hypothetical protein